MAFVQPDRTCRYCDMALADEEAGGSDRVCISCANIREAAKRPLSEVGMVYSYLLGRFMDAHRTGDDALRARLDAAILLFEDLWPEDCANWKGRRTP